MFTNNSAIGRLVRVWTDVSQPVPRRRYVTHGVSLAAVKYLGDVVLILAATGTFWTPLNYVSTLPLLLEQSQASGGATAWLAPALAAWMLPFVAIGLTLTMRRARDAGHSPWLSILFLVPYLNYVVMAVLSALPSRARTAAGSQAMTRRTNPRIAAILAGTAGVLVAVATVVLGLNTTRFMYGAWLFVLAPFATGACTAFVYNFRREATTNETGWLVGTTVAIAGSAMLAVGVEGLICLIMALPLAMPLALLGGVAGRCSALDLETRSSPMFMLLALPLTAAIEPPTGRAVHEVQSSVVIEAPPDAVWPHVVAFREIPPPDEWIFRAGVAYPIRARIDGAGPGAVRYCEFSTGAFVEPITRWEPGRRLSFDVVESPAPMRELSPYRGLSPRHLHGYVRSIRGEFRFVDLGNGRTRLEGSTWYQIEMAPEGYWQIFSDAMIHRVHLRVLDHIKREVEMR